MVAPFGLDTGVQVPSEEVTQVWLKMEALKWTGRLDLEGYLPEFNHGDQPYGIKAAKFELWSTSVPYTRLHLTTNLSQPLGGARHTSNIDWDEWKEMFPGKL